VQIKRTPRKIFGSKRDEVTGELRRLREEELYDLYFSPNTVRGTRCRGKRWKRHVARVGMRKGANRAFVWEI